MTERPPPRPAPASVAEALTVAAEDAAGTMRGRAARALAGLDALAVDTRRRRRVLRVVLAVGIVALVGAGAARTLDGPTVPLADQLVDAIVAGDARLVDSLVADGALTDLDLDRPTEAVRLAIVACDLDMFHVLTGAGALRMSDDGRVGEDAALSAAIRSCGAEVIRDVWGSTRTAIPEKHVMVYAAIEGTPRAVRALAQLGVPVNYDEGTSPLEAAIHAGRADTARELVALGASTRLRTEDGVRLGELLRRMPDAAECADIAASTTAAWRDECAQILHGGRP
ncbi:hypothetical protein QQX09_10915 [Demequina sp. SYSU T00192]|uniref:Ankyrin repeat-containing protein n=1 Tax=Demequina litoralis TaxID=3051660 RepID=A0ABT8GB39_9MICO|nr:hypothetical protein [Demequina sp. SYSU T00192]MDN4476366.1 hypothetical protein [Demequina sp. SYSU T00192]